MYAGKTQWESNWHRNSVVSHVHEVPPEVPHVSEWVEQPSKDIEHVPDHSPPVSEWVEHMSNDVTSHDFISNFKSFKNN